MIDKQDQPDNAADKPEALEPQSVEHSASGVPGSVETESVEHSASGVPGRVETESGEPQDQEPSIGTATAQAAEDTEAVRPAEAASEAEPAGPPAPDAPAAAPEPAAAAGFAWRRGLKGLMHPRASVAGAVIALLVGLLGFALIAQVKSNSSASTLANDRPDDLVRILSDLDARKDRLGTEITSLQAQQRQLNSGAQGRQAALEAAQQRADELGILAGTLPATGPGLVITLQPAGTPLDASLVLEAVEALRDAGAEAMQVSGANGATARIVASTWFVDGNGGVVVDGQVMSGSMTLTVIGDPQTMQTALTIPGEVDDMVKQAGGNVLVEQPGSVTVSVLHPTTPPKYAHPAS